VRCTEKNDIFVSLSRDTGFIFKYVDQITHCQITNLKICKTYVNDKRISISLSSHVIENERQLLHHCHTRPGTDFTRFEKNTLYICLYNVLVLFLVCI